MTDADATDEGAAAEPDADAADETPAAAPDPTAPQFRVMSAESVTFDLADPAPLVHLMETEPPYRYLSIPIALPEAQALELALAGRAGRRPGTHELAAALLARLRADVVAARIVRYEAGVYYAELDVMGPSGREVVDCRTSDAIILALRQPVRAPILCAVRVLEETVGD
ncbi:MAG TPA: bifunctional nuclease domain-containing protein [Acidimicrobiales bacterium]|nr:bifunctional nuclease domain-containing protein [Acidimicrobiales bacterium]